MMNFITDDTAIFLAVKDHIPHYEEYIDLDCDKDHSLAFMGLMQDIHTASPKHRIDITQAPYFCKKETICTAGIQKALDDCTDKDVVVIPAGTYYTGALCLHSDTELLVEEDGVLQGTAEPADYEPRILSRFEGKERMCYQSLLNIGTLDHTSGPNVHNVYIHGKGKIMGGGFELAKKIAESEKENLKDYLASNPEEVASCENENTIPFRCRGRLVNLSNAENVVIKDLTLGQGPSWNIHMIYSRNILLSDCRIESEGIWNGDGIDPDSSENIWIENCSFHTGDDAVAIKAGKNPEGNVINRPTRNVVVDHCVSDYGHGICIGSEMSGGVENVMINDCDMEVSECGIEIKATKKRGGFVRNVYVRHTTAPCVQIHSVGYNDDGEGAKTLPVLEHFSFEDMTLTGKTCNLDHEWKTCDPINLRFDPSSCLHDVTVNGKKYL